MIEAPRGTLIHHYRVGEDDLVTMCNLIVSTTHNNQAMNEAIRNVAQRYLRGHEITEGLLMSDPEAAARLLSKLTDAGMQIAIDDFGTGYSSLSYLASFPVQTLKVDRSIVCQMDGGSSAASFALDLALTTTGSVLNQGFARSGSSCKGTLPTPLLTLVNGKGSQKIQGITIP